MLAIAFGNLTRLEMGSYRLRIVASSIGLPNIYENIGKRFTCIDVDDSDIHEEENAWLPFSNVLSDWVAPCVVAG